MELPRPVRLLTIGFASLLICCVGCHRKDGTPAPDATSSVADPESNVVEKEPAVALADTDSHDAGSGLVAVRAERTANGVDIRIVSPANINTIHRVDWLDARQQEQLATADQFGVFHAFQFADRREESGIRFRHYAVDCSARNYKSVHYDHGNGVAVADVDGDGLYDIYLTTQIGGNELWRNRGGGQFENVTESAGVAVSDRVSVTASFADIDNDGDADLYVTSIRRGNLLFENDGTGKFTDISAESGLGYEGHSSSAVFFDYDRDGLIDMFLTNVGQYTRDDLVSATSLGDGQYTYHLGVNDGFSGHLKPDRAETSILFKNLGECRFKDASREVQLEDVSWTGDATPMDGNDDGWPDLYVLNMQGHDEYYENVEGQRFVKKSRQVFPKTPWGSMGVKVFDFDNDGKMDLYITDMHSDMSMIITPNEEKQKADMKFPKSFLRSEGMSIYGNAFYRNLGEGKFEEVSDLLGAENYWPWGLSVGDLNADGFEDAFVASCMNYPYRYGVNSVLLNDRGTRFLDSEFILGVEPRKDGRTVTPYFVIDCGKDQFEGETKDMLSRICQSCGDREVEIWGTLGSRSSVIFDLDNDGDLDIVTNDFHSPPMVLVSDLTEKKGVNFLKVRLVGTKSNRDGLGARVTVQTASGTYAKIHDGKSGYLSQSRMPLYFGLGDADAVDQVEVSWPSGEVQTISDGIAVNDTVTITEE